MSSIHSRGDDPRRSKSPPPPALPPLPKLRPRPGFRQPPAPTPPPPAQPNGHKRPLPPPLPPTSGPSPEAAASKPEMEASKPEAEAESDDSSTSRLLMKSECKGAGGRRKNTGSLIHSIPKFSQVRPNERLTEVQKMLQSRIISKQQRQRQQEQQQQQQLQQQVKNNVTTINIGAAPPSTATSSAPAASLQASNLLQNIISLHEKHSLRQQRQQQQQQRSDPLRRANEPPPSSSSPSPPQTKRRGRKPAKDEICHVVKSSSSPPRIYLTPPPPPVLPQLSEVTITPTIVPSSDSRKRSSAALALDLRKERRSASPEVLEIVGGRGTPPPPPSALTPADFDRLGMPNGYVFCPGANVFLHPTAVPRHLGPDSRTSATPPPLPQTRRQAPETMASMQSVLRVKPQRPSMSDAGKFVGAGAAPARAPISIAPKPGPIPIAPKPGPADVISSNQQHSILLRTGSGRKRKPGFAPSDGQNEVSICKFKFTGGLRPSLEEKKMLSVDSGGHFRYFSGSGSHKAMKGLERIPVDVLQANASILTDKFTSLTTDRIGGTGARKLSSSSSPKMAANDVIGAFEAMPEAVDSRAEAAEAAVVSRRQ